MFFSKFEYLMYFLVDQSFDLVEDVVTIFHQANKGKFVILLFIAMIHLMRYIIFCFDMILYHSIRSYD